ncbi:amidohydrolase, partial [Tricholoma matsutake]
MSFAFDTQATCFGGFFRRKSVPRRHPGKSSTRSREKNSTGTACDVETSLDDEVELSFPPIACLQSKYGSLNLFHNFSYGSQSERWLSSNTLPAYSQVDIQVLSSKPGFIKTIDEKLDELSPKLRELSLQIHAQPEILWEEKFAHDVLTKFMSEHGFKVTEHYLGLDTAWRAEFTFGNGGRVLGVNSEMDALPGIGHACGHNLIAVSGVGVAIAVKAALMAHKVPGTVVLLGTPAEEAGAGKQVLLDRGGYKDMDVCVMCHPGVGPPHFASTGSTSAMQPIEVEYFGQTAHAGAAPWEGINALDAAFLAYSNISVLRQQMKPDHRVHGIVQGKEWAPNVIPDYAKLRYIARANVIADLLDFVKRLRACFEAAAHATGCKINLTLGIMYYDLRQNAVLANEFTDIVGSHYGLSTADVPVTASTDFGNVSYEMPSFHPLYAIPTEPRGGNHTIAFTRAAATQEAHDATMVVTKGLAALGFRVLHDAAFFQQV